MENRGKVAVLQRGKITTFGQKTSMNSPKSFLQTISVGILVAATGVGAGDIVMAALAGARYGVILLWAILIGGLLKYVLNENLAKWDIATRTTLLQGWVQRLPKVVSWYFGIYLVFWAFLVAGTLITYTGVVGNTIFPLPFSDSIATAIWGGIHSLVAVALIFMGGFGWVEQVMKLLIAMMFLVVLVSAIWVCPSWSDAFLSMVYPRLPADENGIFFIIALIGGVGGSLTILCYSYWLKEKNEGQSTTLSEVRTDLGVAYFLTVLFAMAVLIISAGVTAEEAQGYQMVLAIANQLESVLGTFGKWAFIIGFWGAVFSSLIGVWNGVPYLFTDFMQQYRLSNNENFHTKTTPPLDKRGSGGVQSSSKYYRWFLLYIAFPPILVCLFGRPAWIGLAYAIAGAFFMPFLAATLLYMNNKKEWVDTFKNGWLTNVLLIGGLLLFLFLFVEKL